MRLSNRWLGRRFLWQSGLTKALRATRPDVVVALGVAHYPSCWLLLVLCKRLRLPLIWWTHGLYGNESRVKKWLRVCLYKASDHVMTYGERSKRLLEMSGLPTSSVSAIHNSLDLAEQQACRLRAREACVGSLRDRIGLLRDSRVVVFVGRLTRQKQLRLLLQAFALVVARGRSEALELVVVGAGPERSDLEDRVGELGIGRVVRFLGPIHDESLLSEIFAVADVCVSPGEVGLTAIHAMAYGVPVITHGDLEQQMPEAEAIRPGRTGSFFKQCDVEDLAVQIERWVSLDDAARECTRLSCIEHVASEWSPSFQVQKIVEVCSRVLDGRQ
ncbi:glycosyltransferase [Congregicoccus parvus]|uniref:glycosyltransferase n=1 Tax=Congregicoccus parvus TaxID=3081749 RepID=UPI003FA59ED8